VVGLVAEENTAGGALLIDEKAFRGDILVSIDGVAKKEIGRAAPYLNKGYVTVRTKTSHPASAPSALSVNACAVSAQIMVEAGFRSNMHPPDTNNTIWHVFFNSCGIDEGKKTSWGHPIASAKYNTVPPFATFSWQMRDLEGEQHALQMLKGLKETVERVCQKASVGRSPVSCEVQGADALGLIGYKVDADSSSIQILQRGFSASLAGDQAVTARQFGGFNGNFVRSRTGEEMLIVDTGASQIHTNEETLNMPHMVNVARGILSSMLESYQYRLIGE
jgi:acetylornithine deacetylase/succinyl-diaminopimelate desuccinylase-like protein